MTSIICCKSIYFVLYGALSSTVQWKRIWFWINCRAVNCQSSYSCWVFSQPRSLCLLFGCCAITLKMNHLPLWVLCFWPVYLPHQHRFWTNLKTWLNLISATIILLVCTRWPSLGLKWITLQVKNSKRDSHFFVDRHKNTAMTEWKAFVYVTP